MSKEFIVCGCPRSGTSMVGGILYLLGVDMGTRIKDNKFEDLDILFKPMDKKIKTIKYNVENKKVWGFKDPWIGKYLHVVKKYFKNPHYIFIHRNIDDSVKSDMNRNKTITDKKYPEIRNIQLLGLIDFNLKNEKNVLHLEFEDAFKEPESFVNKIIGFTGIQPDNYTYQNILKFISKKGYKNLIK